MQQLPQMVNRPDPWQTLRIDQGVIPMLLDFERHGVLIDTAAAKRLGRTLDRTMEESAEETQRLAGKRFDVSSDEQYATILFEHLDLPTSGLKKTRKTQRPSVSAEELAKIEHLHPCISTRKTFKECQKLQGTYVRKLPRMLGRDGRLRSDFLSTRTATGRLASKNPNIQNIPSRTAIGKEVKKLFVSQPGCLLVDLDYSQIELRCTAHVSGDPVMIDAYHRGDDLHWLTAEGVFGKPRAELDKREHRLPCKTTNFSVIYGVTAAGLLSQLIADGADRDHWDEPRTQDLIDGFGRTYERVPLMTEGFHQMCRDHKCVWDMWGRVRKLDAIRSVHEYVRSEALRQAGNMPIQGACAGLIKIAMPLVRELCLAFEAEGVICRPLMQVHDSLVFEVSEEAVAYFIPEARRLMASVAEWLVPIETSGDAGENWGEVEPWPLAA